MKKIFIILASISLLSCYQKKVELTYNDNKFSEYLVKAELRGQIKNSNYYMSKYLTSKTTTPDSSLIFLSHFIDSINSNQILKGD